MAIISDEIRWIIDFFTDKFPKPLKYLFFLLLLVGIVSLIPFLLHLMGFHCNSDLNVVQTSPLKIISNIKLAFMGEGEIINTSSYIPDTLTSQSEFVGLISIPIASCRYVICQNGSYFYWENENECDGASLMNPYNTVQATWSRCSTCSGDINETFIRGTFGASETTYLCFGDAQRINESDMSWYQKWVCDEDRCIPPSHYYYEYDTGTYDCLDLDICGENYTTVLSTVDDTIDEAEGQLLYSENDDKNSIKRIAEIVCNEEMTPTLTFYSIPIFDYRIWVFLFIIIILAMFLFKLKKS